VRPRAAAVSETSGPEAGPQVSSRRSRAAPAGVGQPPRALMCCSTGAALPTVCGARPVEPAAHRCPPRPPPAPNPAPPLRGPLSPPLRFVNSASHVWGYQDYNTGDQSRNNWWVGGGAPALQRAGAALAAATPATPGLMRAPMRAGAGLSGSGHLRKGGEQARAGLHQATAWAPTLQPSPARPRRFLLQVGRLAGVRRGLAQQPPVSAAGRLRHRGGGVVALALVPPPATGGGSMLLAAYCGQRAVGSVL
jgi:hypothetical protein